ncbi:MAG: hypothetical protein SGPRY_013193, partial [Prymnesium sp.]
EKEPPGFLAAFYQEAFAPKPIPSTKLRRPLALSPRPLASNESHELHTRLQARVAPFTERHQCEPLHAGSVPEPPYTEGGILGLHLLPVLRTLRDDNFASHSAEAAMALDVCFEELTRAVASRAPDLHTLMRELHQTSQALAGKGERGCQQRRSTCDSPCSCASDDQPASLSLQMKVAGSGRIRRPPCPTDASVWYEPRSSHVNSNDGESKAYDEVVPSRKRQPTEPSRHIGLGSHTCRMVCRRSSIMGEPPPRCRLLTSRVSCYKLSPPPLRPQRGELACMETIGSDCTSVEEAENSLEDVERLQASQQHVVEQRAVRAAFFRSSDGPPFLLSILATQEF